MELGLQNKSVVVTGGSAGIGYATARQFLLEGAKVTITARGRERLDDAVKELSILGDVQGIVADGACEKDVKYVAEQAVSRYGGIDVWINNVGTNKSRAGEI
ncbi:MAG: SDR family NAD(P)-dependent oxidoreductase, partial [Acetatifactor sp.]|nr:SDR family NAD(P)-dependent oxidoreductase [Acetatifactor sp.]